MGLWTATTHMYSLVTDSGSIQAYNQDHCLLASQQWLRKQGRRMQLMSHRVPVTLFFFWLMMDFGDTAEPLPSIHAAVITWKVQVDSCISPQMWFLHCDVVLCTQIYKQYGHPKVAGNRARDDEKLGRSAQTVQNILHSFFPWLTAEFKVGITLQLAVFMSPIQKSQRAWKVNEPTRKWTKTVDAPCHLYFILTSFNSRIYYMITNRKIH
jgi:hypothetical protein